MNDPTSTQGVPDAEASTAQASPTGGIDPTTEVSHDADADGVRGFDAVALIASVNQGRDPALLKDKFDRISEDAFAFLRASAVIGHAALSQYGLPKSPLAWVTGDLHVENFGTFKGENGLVYFDLNDFDEGARLPLAVDLVRLLSSIVAAGRSLKLSPKDRQALLTITLTRAAAAFAKGKASWVERETAHADMRNLIETAGTRRRRGLLADQTVGSGNDRRLKIGGYGLFALKDRARREAVRQAIVAHARARGQKIAILDIAKRVAGKGSLGLPRYAVLARRGKQGRAVLLDLKFAAPSSAAGQFGGVQPVFGNEAERIVAIQEFCQAASPAGLSSCVVGDDSFVLRELQPQEDKLELKELEQAPSELGALFAQMAEIQAAGVLRSAGRSGAAGPDELIAFGQGLMGESAAWIALANDVEADIRQAYKDFKKAWKARDPRLVALVQPKARPPKPPSTTSVDEQATEAPVLH